MLYCELYFSPNFDVGIGVSPPELIGIGKSLRFLIGWFKYYSVLIGSDISKSDQLRSAFTNSDIKIRAKVYVLHYFTYIKIWRWNILEPLLIFFTLC